ncbi:MAG TPA: hypothetical protein VN755_09255, partial [Steroidobacteraceae bacterium]|nr:hypothetical protein [Steroidobacteraceae bacterium]
MIEPVDVLFEILPGRRREAIRAALGLGQDVSVLGLLDQVHAQIAKLPIGDLGLASIFDLRHQRAVVEARVTELLRVLGAQVVMVKLVPVVVLLV